MAQFIEVGKPTRALDTLYDVIKGKKHRSFSEKVIEPIMLKYLELCVELKKAHTAKEGLYQYRIMCQSVNVGLLEKVIRSYIRMAEDNRGSKSIDKKKTAAEASTESISIVEVDDLDNLSMADMTLLKTGTRKEWTHRSDSLVKFLWESYTQCLDLLRNNPRLENLYHDIAQMAFKFCLAYSRKTEFRKLCERLRKHFDDIINRQGSQMNSIDFSSPETQQLNMETRLSQLDSAISLELWQDAYKAIEDIHLLMNQSKKSQTRMMAYYYQKLSLFLESWQPLVSCSYLDEILLVNVSADELQKNASQVVLATMAIPFRFCIQSSNVGYIAIPSSTTTRASIIRDISRHGILTNAIQPLQDLYEVLENQFNPLSLCADVEVTLVRLIKQISQVYQTIDYDHLMNMTVFSNQIQLEQILVDAVRYTDMQITVDHRSNCIKFGASLAEASREDLPEGPPFANHAIRNYSPSTCEHYGLPAGYCGNDQPSSSFDDIIRGRILAQLRQTEAQYHRMRKKHRAEQMIKQQMMMEAQTARKTRKEKGKSEKLELQKRLVEERFKLIGQTPIGLKIMRSSKRTSLPIWIWKRFSSVNKRSCKRKPRSTLRMKSQEKRLDHIERAKRIEEVSVIEQYMDKKKDEEKVEWEAHDAQRIAHLIEERKLIGQNEAHEDDKNKFLKNLLDARRDLFMEKLNEFEKSFRTEKSRRMAERKDQRKQERRRKYDEEKAAAERSRLDAIRKANEEEERIERVRIEKELEERNRVTLEKQLAKQREIEEREERDRQERLTKVPASAAAAYQVQPRQLPKFGEPNRLLGKKVLLLHLLVLVQPQIPHPGSGNVWVPKAIREKKAAAMTGDLPSQENVPPPSWTSDDREERPFERKIERGPDGDRDGERKRMDRGGDRDWGGGYRGDKDRGFDRPRGDRGFDKDRGDRGFDRDRGDRGFDRDRGDRGFDRDRGDRGFDRERGDRG
ncbi:Eukaryotic translation initiation factor 3 subunit A [Orchesella cincta]|uniref:Eukaryotic translation initiation factor 3 subunit A n=1 Tax=Orchesella cincta TaxID=48709 RepID=A0A1D2N1D4_ORCCI|nr:Eukaryotic translation initiation factor 3 subunit A [Orchesella cincta]